MLHHIRAYRCQITSNILIAKNEWDEYNEDQLSNVLPKHIQYFQKEIYYNFHNTKYVNLTLARAVH